MEQKKQKKSVLILGGGMIGSSIARHLADRQLSDELSVTIVEKDLSLKDELDELDIAVVTGAASQSSVLFRAGAASADLCLALTGDDEVNLVGASMAKAMGASRVAARVYAGVFRDLSTFDYQKHFRIDRLLSIEHLTAMEIARRIREPGAMLIEHFAYGEVEMQEVVITKNSSATGVELKQLKLPSEVRIGTITRDGRTTIAAAQDTIEPGDRITLLGVRNDVEELKRRLQTQSIVKQNIFIAGGGEIGYQLAQVLESRNYNVVVMEADKNRCNFLASHLDKTTAIHGDVRQKKTLAEEHLGASDIFIACLGDDEKNVMACVEAGELGAKTLLAVISRPDYAAIVGKFGISDAVSPQEVFARQVKGMLHSKGPLISRYSHILSGAIDVVELEVEERSPITTVPLKEAGLSKQILIAAVIRDNSVLVPNASFQIKAGDNIIALVETPAGDELIKSFQSPSK